MHDNAKQLSRLSPFIFLSSLSDLQSLSITIIYLYSSIHLDHDLHGDLVCNVVGVEEELVLEFLSETEHADVLHLHTVSPTS